MSTMGGVASLEGMPSEQHKGRETQGAAEGEGGQEGEGMEIHSGGQHERTEEQEETGAEVGRHDTRGGAEGESEVGSLSEDSADSKENVGEEKKRRFYWKEVESKVDRGLGKILEKAHAARYAIYEKQVRDVGEIVDPTSSEGEEEVGAAEQRRARRKEREEEMGKRCRKKKNCTKNIWSPNKTS
eukprot:1514724-Pleurochrysis_carterae.AAC.7